MTSNVITTDLIGAGTQVTSANTLLLTGVNVVSTNGTAISSPAISSNMIIAGNVVGATDGIVIRSNQSDPLGYKSVAVTSTGSVLAQDTGLTLDSSAAASTNELTNAGQITSLKGLAVNLGLSGDGTFSNSGDVTGAIGAVKMLAVNNTLFNTGTITALGSGLASDNAAVSMTQAIGGSGLFSNSGTITGQAYSLFATLSDGFEGQNNGTMIGDVIISSGVTSYLTNSGDIFGDISLVNSNGGVFFFRNSGLVSESVFTNNFATLSNAGIIEGEVIMGSTNDTYRALGSGVVGGTILGGAGNDTIIGGSEADRIDGQADDDVLRGAGGADEITGGDGEDTLRGGSGEDSLIGGNDDDNIAGNSGDDVMTGDAGNDRLRGDGGDDTLFGGDDNDRLNGGSGNDVLDGGEGNDTVRAGDGADQIDGGNGENVLFGGDGNDEIESGSGDDLLRGDAGNDYLEGGLGADDLRGGSGNDTIFGGRDLDRMFGGAGEDVFLFDTVLDSVNTGTGDQIRDFTRGEDLLDMSAFDMGSGVAFVGTDAFVADGTAQIRYFDSGNNIRVQVDFDGSGTNDMQFTMYNIQELSADDFIL